MVRINFTEIPQPLMATMFHTEEYVKTFSMIEASFMGLLRYRVSVINKCAYCMEMHFKEAVAAGETEIRLYSSAVWAETSYYTVEEQAVLAWTESVTVLNDDSERTQFLYDELLKYFSQQDIANLTLAIMQINSWNRLAKSFGLEAGHYKVGQHG